MLKPLLASGTFAFLCLYTAQPGAENFTQTLEVARQGALEFVLQSQYKNDAGAYRRGEWPSTVEGVGVISTVFLGAPVEPMDDPNAFVNASIHNILAKIYRNHLQDPRLLSAMQLARDTLEQYRQQGSLYNFWPLSARYGNKVHFPREQIVYESWGGLMAMPPDADTNALVQLMYCYDSETRGQTCNAEGLPIEFEYSHYLDLKRIPHWHNLISNNFETGAFMTFLEAEPTLPNVARIIASPAKGPRIPSEKNTIDCVVNTNVLRALNRYGRQNTAGYASACQFVNESAIQGDWNQCGFYYPQTYVLHFTLAKAHKDKVECIEPGARAALAHILDSQLQDGSWKNQLLDNDEVQATAFAVSSLLMLGDKLNLQHRSVARKGLEFLLQHQQHYDDQVYWSGGVFFSAGAPLFRESVLWKSSAYTTAVVLQAMYMAQQWDL